MNAGIRQLIKLLAQMAVDEYLDSENEQPHTLNIGQKDEIEKELRDENYTARAIR